jgi:hypothetical protein
MLKERIQGRDPTQVMLNDLNDQRKIPLHLFTIGFQKPGICANGIFLLSWDFSLIINRAPRGAGLLCPPGYTFYSRSCASTYKFWLAQMG